jgi:amino acid transporter
MEARADQEGLKGSALTTLEAMVVSMGFMAPSVAMSFNTPFIAGFTGAAMLLAMLFSFAAVFLVALGFSQLARRTASAGSGYAFVSNAIHPRTGFMGMWFFIIGYGIFEAATYSIFASFSTELLDRTFGLSVPWVIPFLVIAGLVYPPFGPGHHPVRSRRARLPRLRDRLSHHHVAGGDLPGRRATPCQSSTPRPVKSWVGCSWA